MWLSARTRKPAAGSACRSFFAQVAFKLGHEGGGAEARGVGVVHRDDSQGGLDRGELGSETRDIAGDLEVIGGVAEDFVAELGG